MTEISFPGLGIGPFEVDSVAFELFGGKIQVAWYGIFIAIGMLLAFLVASYFSKYEGIKSDDLIDLALFVLIFCIIGARLYYVAFPPEGVSFIEKNGTFWQNVGGTLYNIIAVWEGGLAIFGGIIGGVIACLVVARYKKIYFPVVLDICAPALPLAQAIGRWGNFMNGEAYGYQTDVMWRMGLKDAFDYKEVHPTFLYESLWNIVGFVIIFCVYKKKKFRGQMFYLYMMWYGLGRAIIEGMRTDSLYLWGLKDFWGNPIRVSQALAVLVFLAGLGLSIFFWIRTKKAERAELTEDLVAEEPIIEEAVCEATEETAQATAEEAVEVAVEKESGEE